MYGLRFLTANTQGLVDGRIHLQESSHIVSSDPFNIVFAEFLRIEVAAAVSELEEHYQDGGRASGARDERLAEATADAYRAAMYAVGKLPINGA